MVIERIMFSSNKKVKLIGTLFKAVGSPTQTCNRSIQAISN